MTKGVLKVNVYIQQSSVKVLEVLNLETVSKNHYFTVPYCFVLNLVAF